jgi:hypothetical protein
MTTLSNRAIEEAHIRLLQSRQEVAVADDPDEPPRDRQGRPRGPSPHESLQKDVSLYYEALRSALVSSPEGRRYFYGEAPDGPDEQGYGVLQRQRSEEVIELARLPDPPENAPDIEVEKHYEEAIEEIIRDDEVLLRPVAFDTDDNGEHIAIARIERHRTGLKLLDQIYSQRETVEVDDEKTGFLKGADSGFLGNDLNGKQTEQRVVLQPLELLMNAARELDRAAAELDLLAETKESDMTPYMKGFDTSNGEVEGEVSRAELNGSPDMQ